MRTQENSKRHESRAQQALRAFTRRLGDVAGFNLEQSERAAAAVLCALEQRLIPPERQHLEAQLPVKLVELMRRCPFHELRAREIDRSKFLELVAEDLGGGGLDPERCARAVFQVLSELVSAGEVTKLVHQLPRDLRALWPAPVQEATRAGEARPGEGDGAADLDVEAIAEHHLWDPLRDEALKLSLMHQLELFQALAGPLLRALDPAERRGLLHGLQQAAGEITEDENALEREAPPPQ